MQERLLKETELTLQKTIEICRAAEMSKTQSDIIQRKTDVHLIIKRNSFSDGAASLGLLELLMWRNQNKGIPPIKANSAPRNINSSKDLKIILCIFVKNAGLNIEELNVQHMERYVDLVKD